MLKIISDKAFVKLSNSDKPIVLTFFADWCGPCKMQHPILEKLAESDEFSEVEFVKIDVESSEIASDFGVVSIPQILLIKDREVHNKVMGFTPQPQLAKVIKKTFDL